VETGAEPHHQVVNLNPDPQVMRSCFPVAGAHGEPQPRASRHAGTGAIQGYLFHKKQLPHRALQ